MFRAPTCDVAPTHIARSYPDKKSQVTRQSGESTNGTLDEHCKPTKVIDL